MVMYMVSRQMLEGDFSVSEYLFKSKDAARNEILACAKEFMNRLRTDETDPDEVERLELSGDLVNEPDEFYLADTVRCKIQSLLVVDCD